MKTRTAFRFGLLAFGLLLGACGAQNGPGPGDTTPTPPPGNGARVSVWLTTDSQSAKLAPQSPTAFGPLAGGNNPIVIDERQTYQTIEGFGASFTDSAAYLLNEVATASERDSAMANLFTRDGSGIGVSFVRNPMGASDISRSIYSYDDGDADPSLSRFSIAHDQADVLPLTQRARQLNPQLKVMANPWSPPGWMKTSGSMIGGSLLPNMYGPFANYFVKYIQAYAAAGVPIDYISLQNEPLFVPGDYPGMSMDAATQRVVLRDFVLPTLSANQLATRVLVYDHNWDRPDYPDTVLSDPAILGSSQVAGIAWHGYGGPAGVMTTLHNKYPGKENYHTELSGGTFTPDQVRSDFETITLAMRSWSRSFVKWSLALDPAHGPHTGGCGTCNPLVTVASAGTVSYGIDYYTLGHFSKFVLPGARRIYSSNAAGILTVAFVNPDGGKVLVAYNDTSATRDVQAHWGTQSFSYLLPAFSGATFTWSGTQDAGYTLNAKSQIQASSFSDTSGLQTETSTDALGGYDVGFAQDGDWARYANVDFGSGVSSVDARVASAGSGGTIELRIDSPTGTLVGAVVVPVTGGWQSWTIVSGSASSVRGVHDLYAVFQGSGDVGNLNWIQFK
jgi:glucosylceramidase